MEIQEFIGDTAWKACRVLDEILKKCNNGETVSFSFDTGDNTLVVNIKKSDGVYHTHVGWPGATFSELIDNLYTLLEFGQGLSWVKENS